MRVLIDLLNEQETGPTRRGEAPLGDTVSSSDSEGPIRPPPWLPIRYRVEKQKIAAWTLELGEGRVVMLGDSNLSRIPEYDCPWLEIHSFPGAQIHHLGGVIKQLAPHPRVQKVVLAVGLNNCLRLNEVTTIKKTATATHGCDTENSP